MSYSRGIQLTALENMDRLLIKSMLGIISRNLAARWFDTDSGAVATLADADTADGFRALEQARRAGMRTIGLSSRPVSPWNHLLHKPAQSKDLLGILLEIDAAELIREGQRTSNSAANFEISRKSANLFEYFARSVRSGIVELRFAPGRSLMINHDTGEYSSALSINQITHLGLAAMQETQHGIGQAQHEWRIATRILPVGTLEDLIWQTMSAHGKTVLLPGVTPPIKLNRLPRLNHQLSSQEHVIAKHLARTSSDIASVMRATGSTREDVTAFVNAAFACHLLNEPVNVRVGILNAAIRA
jgi:hypothetical protein